MLPRHLTFLIPVLFTVLTGRGQETRIVKFKQQPMNARLQHFYVAGVKDTRTDTSTIGSIRAGLFSKKYVSVNLPGGAASALMELFRNNLKQDTHAMPIILHIQQLEVAEKAGASTTTVTRVAHWLRHGEGGYRLAIERQKARSTRA